MPSLQIPRGERCRRDKVKAWPRQAILAKKFSPRNCQMKPKKRSRNSKNFNTKASNSMKHFLGMFSWFWISSRCIWNAVSFSQLTAASLWPTAMSSWQKRKKNWYSYGNNFQNIKMVEFANDITAGGTPGFVHFGRSHLRLFWYWAPRHYNPRPKKKRPQIKTRPIRVGHETQNPTWNEAQKSCGAPWPIP